MTQKIKDTIIGTALVIGVFACIPVSFALLCYLAGVA